MGWGAMSCACSVALQCGSTVSIRSYVGSKIKAKQTNQALPRILETENSLTTVKVMFSDIPNLLANR